MFHKERLERILVGACIFLVLLIGGFISRIYRICRARANVYRILLAQNVAIWQGQIQELLVTVRNMLQGLIHGIGMLSFILILFKLFEIRSGHRFTMSNLLRLQHSLLFFNRGRSAHIMLCPIAFIHSEFLLWPQRNRPFRAKRFLQSLAVIGRKVIIAKSVKLSWHSSASLSLKTIHLIYMSYDLLLIRLHNPLCQLSLICIFPYDLLSVFLNKRFE